MKSVILAISLLITNFSIADTELCGQSLSIGRTSTGVAMSKSCHPALENAEAQARVNCFIEAANNCENVYGDDCGWIVPIQDAAVKSDCSANSSLIFLSVTAEHACDVECHRVLKDPGKTGN